MNKKTMLIFSLTVLAILMSGCVDDSTDTPDATSGNEVLTAANLIVVQNIPSGLEYLGAPPRSIDDIKREYVDVAGIVAAAEGIYQDAYSDEMHITAVEFDDSDAAENFVNQYKLSIPPLAKGERFVEESFNGHFATRIVDYSTYGGEQVARYSYLWSNDKFVFIVDGNTEDFTQTRALAEATGQ
ncbi:MAG: hypothetical protein M8350_08850 [Methanosarcinaceae archaeon]|nr:hypothetical protein [Methanosarcinaceae archaeon]